MAGNFSLLSKQVVVIAAGGKNDGEIKIAPDLSDKVSIF